MPDIHVLEGIAFGVLDNQAQKAVRDLFDNTYQSGSPLSLDGVQLFNKRKFLPTSVRFYINRLKKINAVGFKFLNEVERAALEEELLYAFYIISADYQFISKFQLEAEDSTQQSLRDRGRQMKQCANLIRELRKTMGTPEAAHASVMSDSEKHLKYLGFEIAKNLVKGIDATMTGDIDNVSQWMAEAKTVVIKGVIQEIKTQRFIWCFNSNLVLAVISLLPLGFSNVKHAESEIALLSPVMGYLGWISAYTLLGINLLLVAKHTIKGPWMNEAEKELKVSTWQRFTTQFDQRKFSILNDFMGSTIGMACFFWLKGAGKAGYFGNVLGIAWMLADVGLSTWRVIEESTNHNHDMERYRSQRQILVDKKDGLKADSNESCRLLQQLSVLDKAESECRFEWRCKRDRFISDMVYKLGTIVAFSVMCSIFLPQIEMGSKIQLRLHEIGTGLYFSLSFVHAAVNGRLDIACPQSSRQLANEALHKILDVFKGEKDDFRKRQLYLDMKQLMGDSAYQDQVIAYQRKKMVHSLLMSILAPTLIFVSSVFLSTGGGVAVLATGFLLFFSHHGTR